MATPTDPNDEYFNDIVVTGTAALTNVTVSGTSTFSGSPSFSGGIINLTKSDSKNRVTFQDANHAIYGSVDVAGNTNTLAFYTATALRFYTGGIGAAVQILSIVAAGATFVGLTTVANLTATGTTNLAAVTATGTLTQGTSTLSGGILALTGEPALKNRVTFFNADHAIYGNTDFSGLNSNYMSYYANVGHRFYGTGAIAAQVELLSVNNLGTNVKNGLLNITGASLADRNRITFTNADHAIYGNTDANGVNSNAMSYYANASHHHLVGTPVTSALEVFKSSATGSVVTVNTAAANLGPLHVLTPNLSLTGTANFNFGPAITAGNSAILAYYHSTVANSDLNGKLQIGIAGASPSMAVYSNRTDILGDTNNIKSAGNVGQFYGDLTAGTNGGVYVNTNINTLTIAAGETTMISAAVTKGLYLVSGAITWTTVGNSTMSARLAVGGTTITGYSWNQMTDAANSGCVTIPSTPVRLSSNDSIILKAQVIDTNTATQLNCLNIVRIA